MPRAASAARPLLVAGGGVRLSAWQAPRAARHKQPHPTSTTLLPPLRMQNTGSVSVKRWTDASGAWQSLGDIPGVTSAQQIKLVVDNANRPVIFLSNAHLASGASCATTSIASGIVKVYDGSAWQAVGQTPLGCSTDTPLYAMSAALDPATNIPYMAVGMDWVVRKDGKPAVYTRSGLVR